jgi:hypothetical protein
MRKLFVYLFPTVLFLTIVTVQAQDEMGGIPYSFFAKRLSMNIPQMTLPFVDHVALLEEDAAKEKNGPLRISIHQVLNYTMNNSGKLDLLNDGSKLWRLNIKSPDAYAVYLHFSSFEIPEGAELFVYTPDQKSVRGKYTRKNEGEEFYVLDLPGDEIIIEYYEPVGAAFAGHFEIASLGHIYRNVFDSKGDLGNAKGNCHLNVKCPEVAAWLNQVNSVVCIRMTTNEGTGFCSGAMIANARLDRTPYVYTAAHCYQSNVTWYFYFDYQASSCEGNSGIPKYAVRGCELRAIDSTKNRANGPDFMLLEITGKLPSTVLDHLYFSGWDISSSIPSAGAAIHHPGGDFKKYSKPRQCSTPSYPNQDYAKYYWQVNWFSGTANKGVTEQGSSGSPLFNAQGHIVGSLSGGGSDCVNLSSPDFYGKIAAAWTFSNNPLRQLKCWLDPDNTGITKLDGRLYSQLSPTGIEDHKEKTTGFKVNIYPNPTDGNIKINGNFNGEQIQCNIYSILGTLVYQEQLVSSNEFELNLDLTNGIYFIELQGKEKKTTHKLVVSK